MQGNRESERGTGREAGPRTAKRAPSAASGRAHRHTETSTEWTVTGNPSILQLYASITIFGQTVGLVCDTVADRAEALAVAIGDGKVRGYGQNFWSPA
jgi:hypothetical protein